MQSAQINSPRFAYQTATPATDTLDDLRVVRGNYAGSFSGKSKQPLWIAAAMIAVVGGAVLGVNLYAGHEGLQIGTPPLAPLANVATPTAPARSSTTPTAPVTRTVIDNPVLVPSQPMAKSGSATAVAMPEIRATTTLEPNSRPNAKSVVVIPKKVAPVLAAPAKVMTPPQQEVAPPMQEPLPTPIPIMEEKIIAPAPIPTPSPDVPPVDVPKV